MKSSAPILLAVAVVFANAANADVLAAPDVRAIGETEKHVDSTYAVHKSDVDGFLPLPSAEIRFDAQASKRSDIGQKPQFETEANRSSDDGQKLQFETESSSSDIGQTLQF